MSKKDISNGVKRIYLDHAATTPMRISAAALTQREAPIGVLKK